MFTQQQTRADARRKLAEKLKAMKVSEVITIAQIERVTGFQIADARYIFYQAHKDVNKDSGDVFVSVHGVGYQKASTHALPQYAKDTRRSIRRKSKRVRNQLSNSLTKARNNGASPDEIRQLHGEIATLGLMEVLSSDYNVGRVVKDNDYVAPPSPNDIAKRLLKL